MPTCCSSEEEGDAPPKRDLLTDGMVGMVVDGVGFCDTAGILGVPPPPPPPSSSSSFLLGRYMVRDILTDRNSTCAIIPLPLIKSGGVVASSRDERLSTPRVGDVEGASGGEENVGRLRCGDEVLLEVALDVLLDVALDVLLEEITGAGVVVVDRMEGATTTFSEFL